MLPANASHKQLRKVVAENLRDSILNGYFKPGEWLRQERIAQDLGVSQMPVREAIKELAAEGLIEHIPYRGVRVVEFSKEDIEDLYAQRAFLESRAATVAATHITSKELAELNLLQDEMEKNFAPKKVAQYRELNRHFHQLLYTASRREYLVRALNQLWSAFPTMLAGNFARTATSPLPGRDNPDIIEHRAIIAALEEHDPARAGEQMREHIEATARQLSQALK
jgi:DNA-binding GntR family transcriptional regulator